MLTVPAYALDPSAIPKQILPKGSAPKPAVPGPKISLPKNIGVITGKIEIFDTPRGGCTAARNPRLLDNEIPVPGDLLFLYRVSTPNPLSTGYGYEIKSRKPGIHKIAVQLDGECPEFRWFPNSREVELKYPKEMKASGQDFTYRRF
jgi:hypothetical protein